MNRPKPAAAHWPLPDRAARAVSEQLVEQIRGQCPLSFARFMAMSLYTPGLGYYSAGSRKFGAAGDFVTAPEITPLFGRALAESCAAVLRMLPEGQVIELGAGSGRMAADLLLALEALGQLPARYCILEPSADLRQRQAEHLAGAVPHLFERVGWWETLPDEPLEAVVVANEVLDALPVERFRVAEQGLEQAMIVAEDPPGLALAWQAAEPALGAWFGERLAGFALAEGYESEACVMLDDWLPALAEVLHRGAMLLVDYGYARREYYHPSRERGTLMCHYRHRAHPDPLWLPGLQDITAYVDFTAVAEAADRAGLQVAGFTTQAHYLLDVGLERLLAGVEADGSVDYFRLVQAVKQLMLPGEMGERFKAMLLTRGLEMAVPGFAGQDFRSRL